MVHYVYNLIKELQIDCSRLYKYSFLRVSFFYRQILLIEIPKRKRSQYSFKFKKLLLLQKFDKLSPINSSPDYMTEVRKTENNKRGDRSGNRNKLEKKKKENNHSPEENPIVLHEAERCQELR